MKLDDLNIKNGSLAQWLTTVEGDEYQTLLAIFALDAQKNMKIPGFRDGTAPLKVVAAAYGESFYADAAANLLPAVYNEAAAQQGLSPVGDPTFQLAQCDKDVLCFITRVEVYPHAVLKKYKGLEAVRPDDSVSDEEMEREVDFFRDNHREVLAADMQRSDDDIVYFSVNATLDGKPVSGGLLTGVPQRFDSEDRFPDLREHLRGRRAGEKFSYEVDMPAGFEREDLAGKRVTLNIRVDEIKERRLRPVNDGLFVPAYKSMADFMEKRRAEVQKLKKLKANEVFDANLRRALCAELDCDIPGSMVERETTAMLVRLSGTYEGGVTRFLEENGMTPEELEAEVRKTAEERVKLMLALDCVAAAEGIDEENDDRREELAFRVVRDSAVPVSEVSN